jgi:hypothetical protein
MLSHIRLPLGEEIPNHLGFSPQPARVLGDVGWIVHDAGMNVLSDQRHWWVVRSEAEAMPSKPCL